MKQEEDRFRVLLLFHDDLKVVEVVPFGARGSGLTFESSAGGMIKGADKLMDFMQAVALDSVVVIEGREDKRTRVFYVRSANGIVDNLKERFTRKWEAELKIVKGEPLTSDDERSLQSFEHVTLGSSSLDSSEGLKRSKAWFQNVKP